MRLTTSSRRWAVGSSVMPEPLSKIRGASANVMGSGLIPFQNEPDLALLVACVIGTWSNVDAYILRLYVRLSGGLESDAASIYLALDGDGPKNATLSNIIKRKTKPREWELFEVILREISGCRNERAKVAHGVWGHSAQIKGALLLTDARNHENDPDKVYVYKEKDFLSIIARMDRLTWLLFNFRELVIMSPMEEQGGPFQLAYYKQYDALRSRSEIVDRLGPHSPLYDSSLHPPGWRD